MTAFRMTMPRPLETPAERTDCPDDVLEFCAALSGLSGKPIVDVRDELLALPIPAPYKSVVIREFSGWSKIGDIHVYGPRAVSAFDVVRVVMMTPFQRTWNWVSTEPLLDAPSAVAAVSEQPADADDALVIAIRCWTCPTGAPLKSPSRRELLEVESVSVRVC